MVETICHVDEPTAKKYSMARRLRKIQGVDFYRPTLEDLLVYRANTEFLYKIMNEAPVEYSTKSKQILRELSHKLEHAINIAKKNEDSRNS